MSKSFNDKPLTRPDLVWGGWKVSPPGAVSLVKGSRTPEPRAQVLQARVSQRELGVGGTGGDCTLTKPWVQCPPSGSFLLNSVQLWNQLLVCEHAARGAPGLCGEVAGVRCDFPP
jgi:hypothetical protein